MQIGLITLISTQKVLKTLNKQGSKYHFLSTNQFAFRPNPFGVPGWRIGRAFLGRLAFRPSPFGALGMGLLDRGTEPGPMVPTMPPFSYRGGRSSPIGKKKEQA